MTSSQSCNDLHHCVEQYEQESLVQSEELNKVMDERDDLISYIHTLEEENADILAQAVGDGDGDDDGTPVTVVRHHGEA